MFSSFAFHQGAALHVCKSRNILSSHIGKDRQHVHVAYLSDKCCYYRNAICSWLTSLCLQGDFSFVSHLRWLSRYFLSFFLLLLIFFLILLLSFDISCESESKSHSVVFDSFQPHGLYSPWNSPGTNTGVGSLSLLQEIFLAQGKGVFWTQGSNPGLPHCRHLPDKPHRHLR